MDRNLGALATDCTQAAARRLYYQWGRKDPFPYPALATDATRRLRPSMLRGSSMLKAIPEPPEPNRLTT